MIAAQEQKYPRLIPRPRNNPMLPEEQGENLSRRIYQQLCQARDESYPAFMQVTAGTPDQNYRNSKYDLREMTWNSFFFAYRFNAGSVIPTQEQLRVFLRRTTRFQNETFKIKKIKVDNVGCKYFAMTTHRIRRNMCIPYLTYPHARHPNGVQPRVRLIWNENRLSSWMDSAQEELLEQYRNMERSHPVVQNIVPLAPIPDPPHINLFVPLPPPNHPLPAPQEEPVQPVVEPAVVIPLAQQPPQVILETIMNNLDNMNEGSFMEFMKDLRTQYRNQHEAHEEH